MKKIFILIVFSLIARLGKADEGMWLPMLLGEKVYADMVKKGLKLKPEQLYSINKSSLKDAIVHFGGGCTAEVVSSKGLLFTNHHCGYDNIASLSSVEHNYLRDGYWAPTLADELPATGLSVTFLVRMEDVTRQVEDSLKGVPADQRVARQQTVFENIAKKAKDGTGYNAYVASFFKGNQFILMVTETYKDIRFVGTPPESIGKFGGDTDNWEWPRHTGDFSVFRIYAGKDNKPADYSADNVPFKPKHHLPVSLKGVKEGDFTMVYGYPGRTNRYETSYGVDLSVNKTGPAIVKLRDARLKLMKEEMNKDQQTYLNLASKYAMIANYWKYFIGQTEQLKRLKVYDEKKKEEAGFQKWAAGKPAYENLLSDYGKNYADYAPISLISTYLNEGIFGSSIVGQAFSYNALLTALEKNDNDGIKKFVEAQNAGMEEWQKEFNKPSELKILATVLKMYYEDLPKDQHPAGFYEMIAEKYKNADNSINFDAYAQYVFDNSVFADKMKLEEFLKNPSKDVLSNDPAFNVGKAFVQHYRSNFQMKSREFTNKNNELGKSYMKGIMEMNPTKTFYPDANSTLRLTYGTVKAYSPRDAVYYNYFTTINGVIEKDKPGDLEFDVPAKLKDLYNKKDYGRYGTSNGNLVVNFITDNDITGGNSGSPVINGNGELIGLAFDGNWEAMSGDIKFDPKYKRCIVADIRYVLWVIDKLGGGKRIVDELTYAPTTIAPPTKKSK